MITPLKDIRAEPEDFSLREFIQISQGLNLITIKIETMDPQRSIFFDEISWRLPLCFVLFDACVIQRGKQY